MIPGFNPLFVDMMAWPLCPIDLKPCSKENCCGGPPLRAGDLDLLDVAQWAEECMTAKPEPSKPHQYSQAAEEAGRRNGFAPFAYEERS